MSKKPLIFGVAGAIAVIAAGTAYVMSQQPASEPPSTVSEEPIKEQFGKNINSPLAAQPAHQAPPDSTTNRHGDAPVPPEVIEGMSEYLTRADVFELDEASALEEMRKQGFEPTTNEGTGSGGVRSHTHAASKPEKGVYGMRMVYDESTEGQFKLVRADYELSASSYESAVAKVEADLRARLGDKLISVGRPDNPNYKGWQFDEYRHVYVKRHTPQDPRVASENPIQARVVLENLPTP